MENSSTNSFNNEVLLRYIRGEANKREKLSVQAWLLESEDNQKTLESMYWLMQKADDMPFNSEKAWKNVSSKMSGKVVPIQRNRKAGLRIWMSAAIFVGLIAMATWLQMFTASIDGNIQAGNQPVVDTLIDGSVLHLAENAEITYSIAEREKGNRELTLKGEAFFDVARDENKPFIIKTFDAEIEVLGTSFYVKTDPELGTTVDVVSGKVALRKLNQPALEIKLEAGDQGKTDLASEDLQTSEMDINHHLWHTKKLVFKRSRLSDVVQTLNAVYNKNISLAHEGIEACQLTATFDELEFDIVLQIVIDTLSLSIRDEGGQIIIDGESCE